MLRTAMNLPEADRKHQIALLEDRLEEAEDWEAIANSSGHIENVIAYLIELVAVQKEAIKSLRGRGKPCSCTEGCSKKSCGSGSACWGKPCRATCACKGPPSAGGAGTCRKPTVKDLQLEVIKAKAIEEAMKKLVKGRAEAELVAQTASQRVAAITAGDRAYSYIEDRADNRPQTFASPKRKVEDPDSDDCVDDENDPWRPISLHDRMALVCNTGIAQAILFDGMCILNTQRVLPPGTYYLYTVGPADLDIVPVLHEGCIVGEVYILEPIFFNYTDEQCEAV
jgi:hypothetical protein